MTISGYSFNLEDIQTPALDVVVTVKSAVGDLIELISSVTGGTEPYTYQWFRSTDPDFSPSFSNLMSGSVFPNLSTVNYDPFYYLLRATDTHYLTGDSEILLIITNNLTKADCSQSFCTTRTLTGNVYKSFNACISAKIYKGAVVPAITVCTSGNSINFNI
jgi:hypothetical protein